MPDVPDFPPADQAATGFSGVFPLFADPASLPPWMWWYWAAMVFFFGLLFGSFFNVCIYRLPVKKSIVRPGSHCYSCGTFLKWYDNIPLVSYLLLRGNCRSCGSHFSPRYFFVELLCGLMFLAIYVQFGPGPALLFHLAFASLLFVGVFTDIDHFILPDGVTIGGFFFAVAATAILGWRSMAGEEWLLARDIWQSFTTPYFAETPPQDWSWHIPLLWSLASAAFGWTLLWTIGFLGALAFRKDAMGMGDIKLFAFLGAYLGAVNCIWILFLSSVLGSFIGGAILLAHKFSRDEKYEDLKLAAVPTGDSRPAAALPRSDSAGGGIALLADGDSSSPPTAEIMEVPSEDSPLSIRVARRTKHQLTTIPYGPYIAVAALVLLLFHQDVNRLTRTLLMLGPPPVLTSPSASSTE